MTMRLSKKLSLVAVSVLLANCGVSSDESVQDATNAVTEPGAPPSDGSFDSREGLTPVRTVTKSLRVTRGDIVTSAMSYLANAAESMGAKKPEFAVLGV